MASPNDRYLSNGVPVDHRLKRFLSSAKQNHSDGVGKHVDIIETFGNTMIRDDKTTPTKHEVDFAAWLAKPDMIGGLVVALQQPAKSQVFTADMEWVRDECETLAYLDKSLDFVNGPGGLKSTSVFDAFPFITEQISPKDLSSEAKRAYNTFISMIEAKRPEVVFACWRIHGQDDLSFSGKGPGRTNQIHSLRFPDGHVVRVVNGFHPSYVANYCPNESCFRRLFAMELCKALCVLNTTWQEEDWMNDIRIRCRARTLQLMEEKGRDGEQLNTEPRRKLRGTRADNIAKTYKAYTKSFDNGMKSLKKVFDHMVSSAYTSQSSWALYEFLVFDQHTSEGICDALLAVSEAMRPFTHMPEPALVELGKHVSEKTFSFVKDDIPDLLQYKRGLYKTLWSNRYLSSTSRGLKQSLEKITIRFIEDIAKSISYKSKVWTYTPGLVLEAFKELAVSFEYALGREDEDHHLALARSATNSIASLGASLQTLSISSYPSAASSARTTPARSSSSNNCFNCGQAGHWSSSCQSPTRKSATTPPRTPSRGECFNCGQAGHWASQCPRRRQGSATPSTSASGGKCFRCGKMGHWSNNCPTRNN